MDTTNVEPAEAPRRSHNKPPATYGKTVCLNCGVGFTRTHHRQAGFHDRKCQTDFHNRNRARGQSLVTLAQAWRMGRNAKGKSAKAVRARETAAWAFSEMCRLLDHHNADDKAAGRPGGIAVVQRQTAWGLLD